METFLNKKYTYALVGASSNKQKYGYKILDNMQKAGFDIIPVNPKGGVILNQKVYTDLESVTKDKKVDVVVFVVQPKVVKSVIKDVVRLGIDKVWLQPGSESDEVIGFCKQKNIACYHGACIMLEHLKFFK